MSCSLSNISNTCKQLHHKPPRIRGCSCMLHGVQMESPLIPSDVQSASQHLIAHVLSFFSPKIDIFCFSFDCQDAAVQEVNGAQDRIHLTTQRKRKRKVCPAHLLQMSHKLPSEETKKSGKEKGRISPFPAKRCACPRLKAGNLFPIPAMWENAAQVSVPQHLHC